MEHSRYQSAIISAFSVNSAKICVNAGPGSGKTTTLVEVVKNAVEPLDYYDTIATCFNVAIREAMIQKFPSGVNVSNFHRIGKQFVENGLKVRPSKGWVEPNKYYGIVRDSALDNGLLPDEDFEKINDAKKALALCQLTCTDPRSESFVEMCEDYDIEYHYTFPAIIAESLEQGIRLAKRGVSIDFNDMIWLPTKLNLPSVRYSNVLIDEAQDLNNAQRKLTTLLAREDSRILCVGDPRQAIYGFAGAAHNSFDLCKEEFGATEYPLSICYRCSKKVVELASTIYDGIESFPGAKEGLVADIKYKDIFDKLDPKKGDLVLSRVTAPIVGLAFELIARKIPAKIKGKDIMANITSLAKKLLKKKHEWSELPTLLEEYLTNETAKLSKSNNPKNQALIASIEDKVECLEVLYNASIADGVNDLTGFNRWITQFFDEEIQGCVTLSTVHKAKGLEKERVFILDPSNMPHKMAKTDAQKIQEENIRWVAYTRAIEEEYLVEKKPRN